MQKKLIILLTILCANKSVFASELRDLQALTGSSPVTPTIINNYYGNVHNGDITNQGDGHEQRSLISRCVSFPAEHPYISGSIAMGVGGLITYHYLKSSDLYKSIAKKFDNLTENEKKLSLSVERIGKIIFTNQKSLHQKRTFNEELINRNSEQRQTLEFTARIHSSSTQLVNKQKESIEDMSNLLNSHATKTREILSQEENLLQTHESASKNLLKELEEYNVALNECNAALSKYLEMNFNNEDSSENSNSI